MQSADSVHPNLVAEAIPNAICGWRSSLHYGCGLRTQVYGQRPSSVLAEATRVHSADSAQQSLSATATRRDLWRSSTPFVDGVPIPIATRLRTHKRTLASGRKGLLASFIKLFRIIRGTAS